MGPPFSETLDSVNNILRITVGARFVSSCGARSDLVRSHIELGGRTVRRGGEAKNIALQWITEYFGLMAKKLAWPHSGASPFTLKEHDRIRRELELKDGEVPAIEYVDPSDWLAVKDGEK